MNVQKNHTLELLKLFASYMVVFIHVVFPGEMGSVVEALARFAVPLFFLISGFYSYKITCEKIKKRIINIVNLIVISAASYGVCTLVFKTIELLIDGDMAGIASLFSNYFSLTAIANLILFSVPLSSLHLWYLFAILSVYIIFYFSTKFNIKDRLIFIIAFSLLGLNLILGEGLAFFKIILPEHILQNFWITGIPFFGLGLFVKKYEHKFDKVPNILILTSLIIGIAETVLCSHYFRNNPLYIGSLFIMLAIVCISMKYSDVQYPSFLTALEGCSTYIYIFHIAIAIGIEVIYTLFWPDTDLPMILKFIHPILVCVASTAISYLIIQLLSKITKKRN